MKLADRLANLRAVGRSDAPLEGQKRVLAKYVRQMPVLAERASVSRIGARPVKVFPTPEGGIGIQVYDWSTGGWVRDWSYFARVSFPYDNDIESVTREEFEEQTSRLRAKLE